MNLIDFTVEKILNEQKGKMYELLGIPKEQLENMEDSPRKQNLLSNGLKQTVLINDMGGNSITTALFNLDKNQEPYKIGDKGVH